MEDENQGLGFLKEPGLGLIYRDSGGLFLLSRKGKKHESPLLFKKQLNRIKNGAQGSFLFVK